MTTGKTLPWTIDSVITHGQLADEVGGIEELENLLPDSRGGDSKLDRESALREVIEALERRTPPIYASNIAQPIDLHRAVLYGTLERLYRYAMTSGSDVFSTLHSKMEKKYQAELQSMQPKLNVGVRGNAYSGSISRR